MIMANEQQVVLFSPWNIANICNSPPPDCDCWAENMVRGKTIIRPGDVAGKPELRVLAGGLSGPTQGLPLLRPGQSAQPCLHCHESLLPGQGQEPLELRLQSLCSCCHHWSQYLLPSLIHYSITINVFHLGTKLINPIFSFLLSLQVMVTAFMHRCAMQPGSAQSRQLN